MTVRSARAPVRIRGYPRLRSEAQRSGAEGSGLETEHSPTASARASARTLECILHSATYTGVRRVYTRSISDLHVPRLAPPPLPPRGPLTRSRGPQTCQDRSSCGGGDQRLPQLDVRRCSLAKQAIAANRLARRLAGAGRDRAPIDRSARERGANTPLQGANTPERWRLNANHGGEPAAVV